MLRTLFSARLTRFIVIFSVFTLAFHQAVLSPVFAENCEEIRCEDKKDQQLDYQQCISQKKSCLEKKVSEVQSQKVTLTNTIGLLNNKIAIQLLQINQIQAEINKLEHEIDDLSERINGLNVSLDRMSTMLIERVREQYKQSRISPFTLLVESGSFDEFQSRLEYLNHTSHQTASGMQKAELQRLLYDQQKELKEKKQAEVEQKRVSLQKEQNTLNNQKAEQQALLKATNNDEAKYQQLLNEAKAQMDSFKKFVSVSGGGVISPDGLGKGYDGTYFSQRDSRWAGALIGSSRENVMQVGCLITSVAMALKGRGVDVTPLSIATNNSYFVSGTAYMLKRSQISLPGGKTGRAIAKGDISKELENNNPVIVGVYAGPYGTHFVLLKKKDGDAWVMYDPWYGPDLKFTSHYSTGSIFSAEVIQ